MRRFQGRASGDDVRASPPRPHRHPTGARVFRHPPNNARLRPVCQPATAGAGNLVEHDRTGPMDPTLVNSPKQRLKPGPPTLPVSLAGP